MLHFVYFPRAIAKERGESYFYSATPCVNGHVAKRHVSGRTCYLCKEEERKTPEGREQKRQYDSRYFASPSVKQRQRERTRRPEVKERRNEYLKVKRSDPEFRKKNAAYLRQYFSTEKGYCNVIGAAARARAAKKKAVPKWANKREIAAIYWKAAVLRRITGLPWQVDHIIPL